MRNESTLDEEDEGFQYYREVMTVPILLSIAALTVVYICKKVKRRKKRPGDSQDTSASSLSALRGLRSTVGPETSIHLGTKEEEEEEDKKDKKDKEDKEEDIASGQTKENSMLMGTDILSRMWFKRKQAKLQDEVVEEVPDEAEEENQVEELQQYYQEMAPPIIPAQEIAPSFKPAKDKAPHKKQSQKKTKKAGSGSVSQSKKKKAIWVKKKSTSKSSKHAPSIPDNTISEPAVTQEYNASEFAVMTQNYVSEFAVMPEAYTSEPLMNQTTVTSLTGSTKTQRIQKPTVRNQPQTSHSRVSNVQAWQ